MLELVGKSLMNRIFTSPYKILISYKGESSNVIVENSGRHYLNQVIKINSTHNRIRGCHVIPDTMYYGKHRIAPVEFLPKMYNLV